MPVYRLTNVVQTYAWGSRTAIADLIGQPSPSAVPQAELWMGTHPKGPSRVATGSGLIPLQDLIDRNPDGILGAGVVRRFGPHLPFLFKVLAADAPLSIQAHPDKQQAEIGFARENDAGRPIDAPDRNYRDDNHKPEILCALTPFWALSGFRPPEEAAALLTPVCPPALKTALAALSQSGNTGLSHFFQTLMTLDNDLRQDTARQVLTLAGKRDDDDPVYRWMVSLAAAYPGDMGLLAPALLNLIRLEPEQAIFLPAGQLHAYLKGVGVELMANSDNVLRGGLTPKHVDVPELLRVVRFEGGPLKILGAGPRGPGAWEYGSAADEFRLKRVYCAEGFAYRSQVRDGVEVLLCTAGAGRLKTETGQAEPLEKGDVVLVPADISGYRIDGRITLFLASVPPA